MNLLDTAWIPVRRKDGKQDWITPSQISEPDIVALDARRPDFNGALIQFLIGLVQTTTPMNSHVDWQQWNEHPPTAETLKQWFDPVRDAFIFDGNGARFMQDFSLRTDKVSDKDGGIRKIGSLLIEVPGKEPIRDNTDHFVKRYLINRTCVNCAATALFTLQVNAPEGGRGHYTSIRGGGPLTTITLPNEKTTLWQLIWINVRERAQFLNSAGNATLKDIFFTFPWMAELETIQVLGAETTPIQVHPAHVYWGMPRRIRLDFKNIEQGSCDICEVNSQILLTRYLTKPNGFDYKGGWSHPLSPYREAKNNDTKQLEWLAVHPQAGGIGYKNWLGFLLGNNNAKARMRAATIINHALETGRLKNIPFRLWAFGYDMDSNKACCWYESTLPLYGLAERNVDGRNLIQREVAKWIDAADHAAFLLRSNVKSAWFGDGEARGDFGFIDAAFWSQTEPDFYKLLRELITQARDEESDPVLQPLRESWRDTLIKAVERLFDADLIGVSPIERQNPRRTAMAFNRLRISVRGDSIKERLKLPVEKKPKKPAKSAA